MTAQPLDDPDQIQKLLIEQKKAERWRESVINMINIGTKQFIENNLKSTFWTCQKNR